MFVADPINKDVVILISKLVKSLDLKLFSEGVEKIEQIGASVGIVLLIATLIWRKTNK